MVAILDESERYATAALFTLAMGICPCALAMATPDLSVLTPDKSLLGWRRFRERIQLAAYRLLKLPPSTFPGLCALSQSEEDELHAHVAAFTRVLLGWSYSGPPPQWPDYADAEARGADTSPHVDGDLDKARSGEGVGTDECACCADGGMASGPPGTTQGSTAPQCGRARQEGTDCVADFAVVSPLDLSSSVGGEDDSLSHKEWVTVPHLRRRRRRDPPHANALAAVWSLLLAVTSFSTLAMERATARLPEEEETSPTSGSRSLRDEGGSADASRHDHGTPSPSLEGVVAALYHMSPSEEEACLVEGSNTRGSVATVHDTQGANAPARPLSPARRLPAHLPADPGGSSHGSASTWSTSRQPRTDVGIAGGGRDGAGPAASASVLPPGAARVPPGSSAAMSLWFRDRLASARARHKAPSSSALLASASTTPAQSPSGCGDDVAPPLPSDARAVERSRSCSRAALRAHAATTRCQSAPVLSDACGVGGPEGAREATAGDGGYEGGSEGGSVGGRVSALWEGGSLSAQAEGAAWAWEYDARTRTALKTVAGWLGVELSVLAGLETAAAYEAEAMAAQACAAGDGETGAPQLSSPLPAPPLPPVPPPANTPSPMWERWNRRVKIGLAAAGGGVLLAVTGGLAAPALAAAVGAIATATATTTAAAGAVLGPVCIPAVAVGSVAAAGLGTAAAVAATQGGAVVIAGGFGVAGARLTGLKVAKRTSGIKEFEFVPVGANHTEGLGLTRLAVTVCMSGWILQRDDFTRPWVAATEDAETHAVVWESEILLELGRAISDFLKNGIVTSAVKEMAMRTILHGLIMALSFASAIVAAAQLIDNPWTLGMDRAVKAGKVLADLISARVHGRRPISLIGYSLGAKAIFHCLEELAARGDMGAVETVALFAAPVPADTKRWACVRTAVAGRLINVFSSNDLLLAIMFRAQLATLKLAGLSGVNVPYVENINVTERVKGHTGYAAEIPAILMELGLASNLPA